MYSDKVYIVFELFAIVLERIKNEVVVNKWQNDTHLLNTRFVYLHNNCNNMFVGLVLQKTLVFSYREELL